MRGFYFSLAVLDSIGDKFGFTNLRSCLYKSEFYDVFKQNKCLRLDFKRIFICLCLMIRYLENAEKVLSVLFTGSSNYLYERVIVDLS